MLLVWVAAGVVFRGVDCDNIPERLMRACTAMLWAEGGRYWPIAWAEDVGPLAKLWRAELINERNPSEFMVKVMAVFGVFYGLRGRKEHAQMTWIISHMASLNPAIDLMAIFIMVFKALPTKPAGWQSTTSTRGRQTLPGFLSSMKPTKLIRVELITASLSWLVLDLDRHACIAMKQPDKRRLGGFICIPRLDSRLINLSAKTLLRRSWGLLQRSLGLVMSVVTLFAAYVILRCIMPKAWVSRKLLLLCVMNLLPQLAHTWCEVKPRRRINCVLSILSRVQRRRNKHLYERLRLWSTSRRRKIGSNSLRKQYYTFVV